MTSLWTPDGERPVARTGGTSPSPTPGSRAPLPGPGGADPSPEELEAMAAEFKAMEEQLANTPAHAVVANHCIGLFQLAALHLQRDTPNLADARLSIDALGAVVDACQGRLGPDEPVLIDALSQIRLAYVSVGTREGDAGPDVGRTS